MRVAERRREAEPTSTTTRHDADRGLRRATSRRPSTRRPARRARCSRSAATSCERSSDPTDLLIEIGVPTDERPHVVGLVDGDRRGRRAGRIDAARRCWPRVDGVGRVDRAARGSTRRASPAPSTSCIAKSDSAALGVYGIAIQRVTAQGRGRVAGRPSSTTRSAPRRGAASCGSSARDLTAAMKDRRTAEPGGARARSTSSSRTRRRPTCWRRSPTTSPASSSAACAGSATRTMGARR